MNELTVAYQEKPTVVLEEQAVERPHPRHRVPRKHLEESGSASLHFARTPAEAVDLALRLATGEPERADRVAEAEFRT